MFGSPGFQLGQEQFPTGLLQVNTFGADGGCGCPSCTETIVVAPSLHTLPSVLNGLYTQQEWTAFIARLDAVFASTHWPAMPCMFAHFCIPFSPICAMSACASRRRKKITEVIMEENKIQLPRGLEWVETNRSLMNPRFLVLRYNMPQRQVYEQQNTEARRISTEPLPMEFQTPGLRAAGLYGGAASAIQMQQMQATLAAQQQMLLAQQSQQNGGYNQLPSPTTSPYGGGEGQVQAAWSSPSAPPTQQMESNTTNASAPPLFCSGCGTKRDSGKFCSGCGKNFG